MSRLRGPFLYDRFLFVTVKLLPGRTCLHEGDFARLANSLCRMRQKQGFLLTAWVFLPDHWHAIIHPPYPLTISTVFKAVKKSSTTGINVRRREGGGLWQERFFDRALRTVREYHEKVEYIHLNPVKAGLVQRPDDWKWSSARDYTGTVQEPEGEGSPIPVDRINLPADPRTRI
jgi:putative transposase